MTHYITRPLDEVLTQNNRHLVKTLLENVSLIKKSLQAGGIIAGGFPRAILLGHDIKTYLSTQEQDPIELGRKIPKRPGDIDIFFKSPDDAKDLVGDFELPPSIGGFAKYKFTYIAGMMDSIQIQLVDHPTLCKSTPEQILDGFDFENCKVAIVGDKIIYSDQILDLEKEKLIRIASNHSPFLGSRLVRYLVTRDMTGITLDSRELLTEWLTRAAIEKFPDAAPQHLNGIRAAVMGLQRLKQIPKEDLIFFIGKWNVIISNKAPNYGQIETVSVDWALNEVKEDCKSAPVAV